LIEDSLISFAVLAATTLVDLSGKENDPLIHRPKVPSLGLGIDPLALELGTNSF
jgi:hypothetical protein